MAKKFFFIHEKRGLHGYYSADPKFTSVSWQWHDGEGASILHSEEITKRPKDYPYFIIIDENGYEIFSDYFLETWPDEHKEQKHFWWMYADEFYDAYESNKA